MNEENVSYYAVIPANVRYDEDLTANAKLLYGEITALCNQKGYCWASNSYFAKLYHVKNWAISNWISQLVKKGYIITEIKYKENTKLIEERRIRIPEAKVCCENPQYPIVKNHNTLLCENTIPYSENSQYPIVKNHIENNTVNNTSNNTKNNTVNTSKIKDDFARLWALYPNKKGKALAEKAYEKAVKKGVSNDVIEKAIYAFIAECKRNRTESRYIPHGGTWFNQERWNDSYDAVTTAEDYEGGENILDEIVF